MNEVNILAFTTNSYQYLNDLPLRVTKRDETAFFVLKEFPKNVTTKVKKNVTTLPNVTTKNVKEVVAKLKKKSALCKHGFPYGLCKFGCVKK